jgi:hypothetical protein
MKLKGINPLEQHVEKLVFAVVGLVFLGVVALQFVGGGNTVDVSGQQVPLDRAYERVAGQAQAKMAQLNQDTIDDRVPEEIEDLSGRIAESWAAMASLSDEKTLPVPLDFPPPPLMDGAEAAVAENGLFRVEAVEPPAPTGALASQYAAAVDPLVVGQHSELQAYTSAAQPYDMRSVTVAAQFDAGSFMEAFRIDPDGERGPLTAIPGAWWQGRVEILDIVLERQEVLDGGLYGETEMVSAMPGRFSLRDGLVEGMDVTELQGLVQSARVNAREVVQPVYYNVIAGERWTPPAEGGDNRADQIDRLLRDLKAVRAEIKKLEDQLRAEAKQAEFENFLRNTVARRQPGRGGGGGRTSRDTNTTTAPQVDREQQIEERLNARIADYKARETKLIADLAALDFNVETGQAPDPLVELMGLPTRVIDAESLRVWAHDVAVEPGATYRYRMRVVVNNPLYGNGDQIADEQRSEAAAPVVESEWSSWTTPVSVDDNEYWFATRATPGGEQAIGRTNASALTEIYTFYYGYWRRAEQRLQAGDEVLATIDVADLNLPVFEIVAGENGPTLGENTEMATEPILADAGAVILDVREAMPSAGRNKEYEVVVRESDGRLTVRRAARELASAVRSRLEANFLRGQTADLGVPGLEVGGEGEQRLLNPVNQPAEQQATPSRDEDRGDRGGRGG